MMENPKYYKKSDLKQEGIQSSKSESSHTVGEERENAFEGIGKLPKY